MHQSFHFLSYPQPSPANEALFLSNQVFQFLFLSTNKNAPSTSSTTGILSLGLESKSICQRDSSPLMLEIINKIDFGIIGVHCLRTRLPP